MSFFRGDVKPLLCYRWLGSCFSRIIGWGAAVKSIASALSSVGIFGSSWILSYILEQQGGQRSRKYRLPVDKNNEPLPWYTYPAIEYLQRFDFSKCDVFEYGGGNSSKFWASRAKSVTSVESDPGWYQKLAQDLLPNQEIILKTDRQEYVNAIHAKNMLYDVIVIDGRYRYNCVIESLKKIKEGGMIILDNSDWYPNAATLLREKGFVEVDFIGLGPINLYAWCTSVFFKHYLGVPWKTERMSIVGGRTQISNEDAFLEGENAR
jgi:hypothetical protein